MESLTTTSPLACTQCGGELHPEAGQVFLTCPYCAAAVYLDRAQVVFHWYVAPTLDENGARGSLARWMAGNHTVKDLDQKSRLVSITFEYFPVWYFKDRQGGKETVHLEPAAATSVSELRNLNIPAGDLRKYTADLDAMSQSPTVPLEAAQAWLLKETPTLQPQGLVEKALVHIPLYTCKYAYQNQTYTAIVEAGTGAVFANVFPAKAEAPYLTAAGITAGVYLCLALVPVVSWASGGADGLASGLAICGGVGLLAAPLLLGLAAWVAAKV